MEIVSSINAIELLLALKEYETPEVFNNKTKSRVAEGCNDVTCDKMVIDINDNYAFITNRKVNKYFHTIRVAVSYPTNYIIIDFSLYKEMYMNKTELVTISYPVNNIIIDFSFYNNN